MLSATPCLSSQNEEVYPEIKIYTKGYNCHLCDKKAYEYVEYKNNRYHCKCYEAKLKREIVNLEWDALYKYVVKEIMGYSEGMSLSRFMVLRLKGLNEGTFVCKHTQPKYADYSFKSMMYTFMVQKISILRACQGKEFGNEEHKFNYIMKIIESNINDTVLRMRKVEKTDKKSENLVIENLDLNNTSNYKNKKSKEDKENKVAKKLENLW